MVSPVNAMAGIGPRWVLVEHLWGWRQKKVIMSEGTSGGILKVVQGMANRTLEYRYVSFVSLMTIIKEFWQIVILTIEQLLVADDYN